MRPSSIRHALRARFAALGAGLFLAIAAANPALARSLEAPDSETDAIKACEKSLCTMILEKEPKGDDLSCDIQKTWAKDSLEGGKSKGMSWGFGDARCHVDLSLSRADLIAALTRPKHTVRVPAHDVNCVVIREGEERPVNLRVAPKLTFKRGRADKVWINLENIEGPADVRATVWTAANLEDTLGVFHRPLIRSINRFIHRRCEQKWGEDGSEIKAEQKKQKKQEREKKAAAKKARETKAATGGKEGAAAKAATAP